MGEVEIEARQIAADLLAADPELAEHPALRSALLRRLDEAAEAFLAKS